VKKIHTVVAVVGLVLAGGAAWWWQNKPAAPSGGPAAVSATNPPATGSPAPGAPPAGAPRPGGAGGPGGPAVVEVAKAEATTLTDDVQAVGSLKSEQGVTLRPETSGRIARLGFTQGQSVKRGQLMVQLDDTLQQAQLKQAQAQASIANTRLQRNRELLGQGFVSQSAVDQSLADVDVAQAQVALAQAQIARMQVLAPFSGTAGLRAVDVGDYVKDGADIVRVEDLSALTVQFALPERTLDRLRVGQAVELNIDALPGRKFTGRVKALDSQVDANGRALQVLAQVTNTGALLKPGMFARAQVVFAVRENAVVVPEEALVPLGNKQLLFKVVDAPAGAEPAAPAPNAAPPGAPTVAPPGAPTGPRKIAQRIEAKLGLRLAGKVEILEGVKAGDVLVTAGHARLLRGDNTPVRVVDLTRPARAPGAAPGAGPGAAPGAAPGAVPGAAPAAKPAAASGAVGGAAPGAPASKS
jgi:membrane fusion protein, multidrug efflux system